MEKIKLNFKVEPTYHDRAPKMAVILDNNILIDEEFTEPKDIELELDLREEREYKLGFNFHGKSEEDTVIDEDGNILKDQLVKISAISLDDIDITSMLSLDANTCYYSHDGIREPFYDTMGRNGTSIIKMRSPLYCWLLEKL